MKSVGRNVADGVCLFALLLSVPVALMGCRVMGWNARGYMNAWDELRCDRRAAVFINLRLDTDSKNQPTTTSPSDYNRALAYLHARGVAEVIFSGRTTAHGTLAEFRALNAGFSSVPDPAYKSGHATITWNVPRTYHFAPEDTQGKYHPSTFWPRIFGSAWSDDYIATRHPSTLGGDTPPILLLYNYYGSRCRIQQLVYGSHETANDSSSKGTPSWTVVKEWEEEK